MSELKAVHAFDVYEEYTKTGDDDAAQVYLKSEADKVIAELEDDCAYWKNMAQKNAADNVVMAKQRLEAFKRERRHKYKRCLAMAHGCKYLCAHYQFREVYKKRDFFRKWMFRYLAIAEKFKEEN